MAVAVPQEAWQHRRGAELVKVLALAPEHRLHREQVIEALWPELPYDAALANLHKAAHFARRAIGESDAVVVQWRAGFAGTGGGGEDGRRAF